MAPAMAAPNPPPPLQGGAQPPPVAANGGDPATEPVRVAPTAVDTPEAMLADLMDRGPSTRQRARGGRLAAIAARLVGMNDR
jgi:hypothetical protein